MMERLRVLMYSERMVEDSAICLILQNEYNEIYFAANYDIAETFLLNITFHIIFIDYRNKDHYDHIAEILIHRHLMSQIVVLSLPEDERFKVVHEIRAPSDTDTSSTNKSSANTDDDDWFEKDGVLRVGGFEINTNLRRVTFDNQRIKLTRIQFDLLYCLASNKNKVLTYDQLIESVWRGEPYENNVVKTHVSRLRKNLSDVTGRDHIINEKGYGYYFSK